MSNLRFASLIGADFTGANARGVDFHGANMSGSILVGANLAGSDFSEVNFSGTRISSTTNLQGANFAGANIQGMTFQAPDGTVSPVSYTQLQDLGVQGVGLNVAAEKAAAHGVSGSFVSTDNPAQGTPSFAEAMKGFSGLSGGQEVNSANIGQLAAAETPAEARPQQDQGRGTA